MKKNKEFFENQTGLTGAKIKIFKEYVEGYLPKILIPYKKCFIADFFSGPGKNGDQNGSPLILIDRINYILTSPQLTNKEDLKIDILFNDFEEKHISNLKSEIDKKSFNENIVNIYITNKSYDSILNAFITQLSNKKVHKFVFLDPYAYSDVKVSNLQKLIKLQCIDILLFTPIFHSYRFANANFAENHKTRMFVEEFTTRGVADYEDVNDYIFSIKEKLEQELSTNYVRPVLLDNGSNKNALFLITTHPAGMSLMNKVVLNNTQDGNTVDIKNQNQTFLFNLFETTVLYKNMTDTLVTKLQEKDLSNEEIVKLSIESLLLPKHAKKIIVDLAKNNRINVVSSNGEDVTNKSGKWNIAEKINKTTIFKWVNNEKN